MVKENVLIYLTKNNSQVNEGSVSVQFKLCFNYDAI